MLEALFGQVFLVTIVALVVSNLGSARTSSRAAAADAAAPARPADRLDDLRRLAGLGGALPCPPVPVYLVRHAHAGNRSRVGRRRRRPAAQPQGPPAGRPALAELAGRSADRPGSCPSPAARCVRDRRAAGRGPAGLERRWSTRRLAEGADAAAVHRRPCSTPSSDGLVLCSHGDLIPKVIRRLSADGMRTKDPNLSQKGSIWVLEVVDGAVVSGRYRPPPRLLGLTRLSRREVASTAAVGRSSPTPRPASRRKRVDRAGHEVGHRAGRHLGQRVERLLRLTQVAVEHGQEHERGAVVGVGRERLLQVLEGLGPQELLVLALRRSGRPSRNIQPR